MAIKSRTRKVEGVGVTQHINIQDSRRIAVAYHVHIEGDATVSVEHSLNGDHYIENTDNADSTTSFDGNYILPVRAVRARVKSGTGTATLIVRQLVV